MQRTCSLGSFDLGEIELHSYLLLKNVTTSPGTTCLVSGPIPIWNQFLRMVLNDTFHAGMVTFRPRSLTTVSLTNSTGNAAPFVLIRSKLVYYGRRTVFFEETTPTCLVKGDTVLNSLLLIVFRREPPEWLLPDGFCLEFSGITAGLFAKGNDFCSVTHHRKQT